MMYDAVDDSTGAKCGFRVAFAPHRSRNLLFGLAPGDIGAVHGDYLVAGYDVGVFRRAAGDYAHHHHSVVECVVFDADAVKVAHNFLLAFVEAFGGDVRCVGVEAREDVGDYEFVEAVDVHIVHVFIVDDVDDGLQLGELAVEQRQFHLLLRCAEAEFAEQQPNQAGGE